MPSRSNRLIHESSPYLLQHAHNPVDWYPWGDEAFRAATDQDKPVLLSVGYSACHWCHVMERESFENDSIADLMNESFINIKVDREERPDVDSIYMSAIQLMTGQGGWPMTVFLTPDGKPFYGGTYYPPEDRYGHPGFPRVLAAVTEAWKGRRDALLEQGQDVLDNLLLGNDLGGHGPNILLTEKVLDTALDLVTSQFDSANGGFGGAPKFPQPANLDFLMRSHARTNRTSPLSMVEKTCQKMALGGIYDQLGGGFHRYSTDSIWLAPHFEKMLYDNAQLAQTYARLWQATGKTFYKGIAEETLEYLLREMTGPEGQFFSAQDADSESIEGKFFVWTPAQLKEILGERDARVFGAFFDVTATGNWEGVNILRVVKDAQQISQDFQLSLQETAHILDSARAVLLEHRNRRIKPALDDKALAAWNGLALAAFAECAAIFNRTDFYEAACKNARFMLNELSYHDTNGLRRLHRTYRAGRSTLNGYLEDYAFVADGLLRLYEADGDPSWIDRAGELTQTMIALFWDDHADGFYSTSLDHEQLIHRPKSWDDNACPSGNSVAVDVLLRMSELRGDAEYRRLAELILRKIAPILEKHPLGFGRMLGALDQRILGATQITIVDEARLNEAVHVGQERAAEAQQTGALHHNDLARAVFQKYLPTKIVVYGDGTETSAKSVPLLSDRHAVNGLPTAYVCRRSVCKAPVVSVEGLLDQLKS